MRRLQLECMYTIDETLTTASLQMLTLASFPAQQIKIHIYNVPKR
jgi:hypothetical protein